MEIIVEIRSWNGKPKDLVNHLCQSILSNEKIFSQTIDILKSGSDVEKGIIADVLKHVSESKPELILPYINELIIYVNYKAPRVKWGIPEAIGNMAKKFPHEAEKAVPYLLKNTSDESTVVRWCAAYALSEIVKNNKTNQEELLLRIKEIANTEQNNGVRNVYLKAIKTVSFRNKPK